MFIEERENTMTSVQQLLDQEMLVIGKKARDNPERLPQTFALGVANKDYPAQTPRLWNAVYAHLDVPIRNVRTFCDPEKIDEIFSVLTSDRRYIGGDVGVGFKDKAWKNVQFVDPIARAMESINVVVREGDGALKGYNTDGVGFAASLESLLADRGETLTGKRILLLGGGGTTHSVAFALAERKAHIIILNRTVEKARKLSGRINDFFAFGASEWGGREDIEEVAPDSDVLVNLIDDPTSPLDRYSALGPITLPISNQTLKENYDGARSVMSCLKPSVIIADVMLRETETATLLRAREAGFQTLDGRPMVLNQAIEAFWLVNKELLTHKGVQKADVARIMRETSSQM